MTSFIEYPLADGGSVVVEVSESAAGVVPVASPGEVAAQAGQTFEDALEKIRPAVSALITKLRDLGEHPDEVTLEFGLDLKFDVGAIFAKTSAAANYKVTMTWKSKTDGSQP